jgi:hypothetical protein
MVTNVLWPRQEQIRQCSESVHLAAVLDHFAQTGLQKAELLLDHSEGRGACTWSDDELWRSQSDPAAFYLAYRAGHAVCLAPWQPGTPRLCRPFPVLSDALIPRISGDHLLLAMQQLSYFGEVIHVGASGDDGVDQARALEDACMGLHPEILLVALLGLVHLRIPLAALVLGGAGRTDQSGIDDRPLPHRNATHSDGL